MDVTTRKYINDLATRVISVYGISIPIFDIESVVKQIGGNITTLEKFDDLCDGTIMKNGDIGFNIAISPFQNNQRKAFTVAHELGHLFLHMGYLINIDLWKKQDETVYRRFGTSEQEYQANEFAAAFLMPMDRYREIVNKFAEDRQVDISKVAQYFNVSISAATNRGRFLGYLA